MLNPTCWSGSWQSTEPTRPPVAPIGRSLGVSFFNTGPTGGDTKGGMRLHKRLEPKEVPTVYPISVSLLSMICGLPEISQGVGFGQGPSSYHNGIAHMRMLRGVSEISIRKFVPSAECILLQESITRRFISVI